MIINPKAYRYLENRIRIAVHIFLLNPYKYCLINSVCNPFDDNDKTAVINRFEEIYNETKAALIANGEIKDGLILNYCNIKFSVRFSNESYSEGTDYKTRKNKISMIFSSVFYFDLRMTLIRYKISYIQKILRAYKNCEDREFVINTIIPIHPNATIEGVKYVVIGSILMHVTKYGIPNNIVDNSVIRINSNNTLDIICRF